MWEGLNVLIALKKLAKVFHKGKSHDAYGADKADEEEYFEQMDA